MHRQGSTCGARGVRHHLRRQIVCHAKSPEVDGAPLVSHREDSDRHQVFGDGPLGFTEQNRKEVQQRKKDRILRDKYRSDADHPHPPDGARIAEHDATVAEVHLPEQQRAERCVHACEARELDLPHGQTEQDQRQAGRDRPGQVPRQQENGRQCRKVEQHHDQPEGELVAQAGQEQRRGHVLERDPTGVEATAMEPGQAMLEDTLHRGGEVILVDRERGKPEALEAEIDARNHHEAGQRIEDAQADRALDILIRQTAGHCWLIPCRVRTREKAQV